MEHIYVFGILLLVLILFIWGRVRHDFVALIGLLTMVILNIVDPEDAFTGFGHPAVITVAAVLIIGKAFEHSGLIDLIGKWVSRVSRGVLAQITVLSIMVALASAFMNNVGALAILMPVAIHMAQKNNYPPSYILMPIAFASLFGGMITLIGTPPNIIIASLRAEEKGSPFSMFDFAPVGLSLTVIGVAFISLLGWRLLPKRAAQNSQSDIFRIEDYITEVKIPKGSEWTGKTILELINSSDADVQILGLVRKNKRIHAPNKDSIIQEQDVIILESDTKALKSFLDNTGTQLAGNKRLRDDAVGSGNISITEAVVMADSPLIGNTTDGLRLRRRFGINLLAVARKSQRIHKRLDHVIFKTGDVLMLQGRSHMLNDAILTLGCLPLAKRELRIGYKKRIMLSVSLFAISIGLIVTGLLPVHISFPLAAMGMIFFKIIPVKDLYQAIDWPVIVLLGAMLPVGIALETSGGAQLIADQIIFIAEFIPSWAILVALLIVTMLLSAVINNAATVVLMAPIGISIAKGLQYNIDPFLMIIAVGASAAFLTPIGHQSNTLVMGPGGYRFSDYIKMGLPLTLLVTATTVPLIIYFWPLK